MFYKYISSVVFVSNYLMEPSDLNYTGWVRVNNEYYTLETQSVVIELTENPKKKKNLLRLF